MPDVYTTHELGTLSGIGENTHEDSSLNKSIATRRRVSFFVTVTGISTNLTLTVIGSMDGTNWAQLRNGDQTAVIQLVPILDGTYFLQFDGICNYVALELTAITGGTPTVSVVAAVDTHK